MSEQKIKIHDKYFKPYITEEQLKARIADMGQSLTKRFKGQSDVVALGVLNGAFIFMADLIRQCDFDMDLRFIKIRSYDGMQSSGKLNIDRPEALELKDKHVLIVEDIIDTGLTMKELLALIRSKEPASITVITLLQKPSALEHDIQIDEVGFSIPPAFVVGYGLDYDDLGRNIPGIYQLDEQVETQLEKQ